MKKIVVVILIGAVLSLGFTSGAFCDSGSGRGGGHGGGYSGGHGGGYSGSHNGGAYYYQGGGNHYYRGGSGLYIGGYFGFPYYYPYPYYRYYYPYSPPSSYYPPPVAQAPVYVEPLEESYWYYCRDPQGYYPYVESCPGGWMRVVPTPPPPGREGASK